ncbi:putative LDB19 N-terminal domain-containing protein [Seiridium unicorne]|uniref:LDB19 N-terminal domain-containing protein n=1 Tax=Seiridium unicorne TaxID=138068 RepID=A0ABR2UG33_9PEZI
MPHRVTSFFRSPNDSINTIKASVQRRRSPSSRSPATTPTTTPRPGSTRTVSYPSSIDEEAEERTRSTSQTAAPPVRMPESAREKDVSHHRLSFPGLHLGGHKSKDHSQQHPLASLDWKIESPPAVMYGDAENSTGALVSGQLLLAVKEAPFEVESFKGQLDIHVIRKRPYKDHCHDCANQKTELKSWELIAGPATLTKGMHYYPFSALLEGHLPASTDNSVVTVRYDFTAEVKPKTGPALKLAKVINVKRSLPVPETPHHSVRIFPPTNITASVHYPNVIHPIGSNKLELRLEGIIKSNPDVKTIEYWKLKRLSWKIEEHLNTVAPACQKHSPKDPETAEPTKKGLKRTEARTVGSGDIGSGWKADYSLNGNVETEIEYQVNPSLKPVCDMKSHDGTEVTHQLVIEMVVAQEYAPVNQPKHVTPTGVARILRMHFGTIVTERAGLGVSWDNEAPPIYQDVPPSPPSYHCEIPYEEVEILTPLESPERLH